MMLKNLFYLRMLLILEVTNTYSKKQTNNTEVSKKKKQNQTQILSLTNLLRKQLY